MPSFCSRRAAVVVGVLLAVVSAGPVAVVRAEGVADDVLYSDPDGQSSATIVQVLPNAPSSQMILTNIKSIRVRQDILIIAWGGSATTLLPRQYVSEVTVNKRIAATTAPAKP
jgi:hypothetical protein